MRNLYLHALRHNYIIYFPCSCGNWCDVLFNFLFFFFCFCLRFIFMYISVSLFSHCCAGEIKWILLSKSFFRLHSYSLWELFASAIAVVVVVGVRSNFHFALRFVFYFNWIKRFITKILTTFHTEFWSLWMCAEMRNILVFFFFFFALWKVLHISRQSKHTFVRQTKNKPPKASSEPGNHAIFTFVFNLKLNRSENARIVWTSNKNDE